MTTPLQARPIPDIVTELPGPKARAHIEFDHAWTSPSLPRAYPIVPVRGLGCAIEDIDGNVFLDFTAGIAVNSTGHSHPDVVAAIQTQAASCSTSAPATSTCRSTRTAAAELARIAPMRGPDEGVHRQLRRRGGRGRPQARPLPHAAPERDRVPRCLPRPDDGRRQPHGVEGEVPRPLRADAPGRVPRALRQRGPGRDRAAHLQAPDAGRRVRRGHRGADPGRGRLRRARGRLPAASPGAVRSPRHPADRGRGPVRRGPHRQDVGDPALGRGAGHPAHRQGHRLRDADRRDGREGRGHELGPGRPRQHVRRQPGRPRRAARDDQASRERAHRQRRDPRPRDPGRAAAAHGPLPEPRQGRPRQGPDDRRPVRLRRYRRGRPDAGLRARACWSSRPATTASGCRRRSS